MIVNNLGLDLLVLFTVTDMVLEVFYILRAIYVPSFFGGILLGEDLTPIESWVHLKGVILDSVIKEYCQVLVDLFLMALTFNTNM